MKKDTKKAKSSKTDKTDNQEKKTTKSELKPAKATKTGNVVKELELKPAKATKAGKVVKELELKPAKATKAGKVVKEPELKPAKATKTGKVVKELELKPAKAAKTGKVVKEPEVKPAKATKATKTHKAARTNDLPAQARRITGTPHMGEQPRNEIWYTTNDGKPVDIRNHTFGRNVVAKDHTFDGKNGVIRCNGVITEIGSTAFYACHNLTSISIPKSVDIINTYAFVGCTNLADVTCKPTAPPSLGLNIFTNSIISTVHVPVNSVDAYKSANGWVFYKENIVPFTK